MVNNEVIKGILGQFGALVLAVVFLWQIMGNYEQLIDQMITDHGQDRQLYRESMEKLTEEVSSIRKSIEEIQRQLHDIKKEI
tara:strand:- start:870 stop:1115 length:246 start_codon:yes stop_codon:yes gene_type:complete